MALLNDGKVTAWGDNAYGLTNVPPDLTYVIAIAAGWNHSMALKDDGTVVSWGHNTFGQTNAVSNLTNVFAIAAADNQSLALTINFKILSLLASEPDAVLRFQSFAGRNYRVESSPDLNPANWQPASVGSLPGTGREMIATETNALADSLQRFYRIRESAQ